MDIKLLVGGVVLAGVGLGAYALMAQLPQQSNPGKPAPAPSFPSPSTPTPSPVPPIADATDGLMCAQVMTKCADGSRASTPCGCRDKGGAARSEPGSVIAEPRPLPAPEVMAVAGVPVQTFEPVIAPPTIQPVYSDIEDRPIRSWDHPNLKPLEPLMKVALKKIVSERT